MPGPVDGCVEDGGNHDKVKEHASPLGVVHQPQAQEIKEHNTTLEEERFSSALTDQGIELADFLYIFILLSVSKNLSLQ